MKRIVAALVLLCALLSALSARSQDEPVITLIGTILDASTGEPIAFATIALSTGEISTLSNDEGRFIFKIPVSRQNDSVFITHVGYHNLALPAGNLGPGPGATKGGATLRLQRAPTELADITVRPPDGWALIQQAIDRIPGNYPNRPFVLTGFYRSTSTLPHPKHIIGISEALFTLYSPDNRREDMQFRLIRGRNDKDLTAMDGQSWSMGFRPDDIMNRDMISRIHQTQILGDEGHNDHQFTYGGVIDYEGRPAYEIRFDQKDGIVRPLYKGRIIIDTASMAFLCFDYGISPKGLPYQRRTRGPAHNVQTDVGVIIRYKRYGGKYYLHQTFLTGGIHSYIDGKQPVDHDTFRIRVNCLITRIDTGYLAFSRAGNKMDNARTIENQLKANLDVKGDAYWENYNLIEADYNVDSALAVIRSNNARPKKRG